MRCLVKHGGGLCERLRVGAVLLAAGEGSRLGSVPKCLLRLQGVPLIHRHLIALSEGGIDDVVVVTGYHHAEIEPALDAFSATVVRNPHPESGQQSSVRLGMEALGSACDLMLVVLADQPLLSSAEFTELIAAFKQRPAGASILYPEVRGVRGNPVVFSGEVIADLFSMPQSFNCRKFMDDHPELVHKHISDNDRYIIDLDTPEDLRAFEKKTGWALSMKRP